MSTLSTFAARFKGLRESAGLKQSEAGEKLGVSRGAISFYENCERTPDIEFAVKASRLFNVSTDYLLGESDTSSRDTNLQSVCQYTKLSENAVKQILDLQQTEAFLENNCVVSMTELLSMILENSCFVPMMEDFQFCLHFLYKFEMKENLTTASDQQIIKDTISDLRKRTKADFILLPDYEISNYYRSQVEDFCGQLITSIIGNYTKTFHDEEGGVNNGKPQDND